MSVGPAAGEPRLAVVVLNWNNACDTLECLQSLAASGDSLTRIVVDNGSTDDSVEAIGTSGLAHELLTNEQNLGYTGGNNVGITHALKAGFDYVAVLNNDTTVTPGMFATLLTHLQQSSQAAAISPVITYYDEPDHVWFAGGLVEHGWPRHLQPGEYDLNAGVRQPSQTLTGCCIVASRDIWLQVGLFDPALFVYFEDSDWSMRARHADVTLLVATDARLLHKVSRSFQTPTMSRLGSYYFARNGLRFHLRYFPRSTPRFLERWLLRPAARRLLRRPGAQPILFSWLGACAAMAPRMGRAPRPIEVLAKRRAP